MQKISFGLGAPSQLALAVAMALTVGRAQAQDQPAAEGRVIEEVIAVGRFLSAAESISQERLDLPVSADFLSAEVIARAGDTDIASALRRVPGITLIDGKFVYVRGLGERYSSVLVNGAAVPSPDLTRSVVPLDLFPTSIVESIKIQKSPSPDATAAFGGGMIDIRTNSVPQDVVASFDIGLGFNSVSDDRGLVSSGGGTPLPATIAQAIPTYRGNISVSNIFSTLRVSDPQVPLSQAQTIHQGLLDSLNQDVGIRTESLDQDMDAKIALGNAWQLGNNWTFGVLLNGTYSEKWRNQNQRREAVGNPTANFVDIERTVYEEQTVSALQFGLELFEDHSIEVSSFVIRNDENEANVSRGFDQNNQFPDQKVGYETRLQERELKITQMSGSHSFLESGWITRELEIHGWENLEFDWFYSESEAATAIPNATTFQASALLDETTGESLESQILASTTSGQFSFLDLDDEQDSWGGNLTLPLEFESMYFTFSGGWWGSKKTRSYGQTNVNLNAVGVLSDVLSGTPGDVLVPGNVTVANGFDLTLGSQFGTESYLAAQTSAMNTGTTGRRTRLS
jgi:hypothetical protein